MCRVDCGRALHRYVALAYAACYSGLRARVGAVAYFGMAGYAYLPAEHAPLAYLCRAGHAYLRRHNGVCPYVVVVRYLHKVVELHALAHVG